MTSKTAQMYLDAAARVSDMEDDELARWYADAVQQYTVLSLWRRLDHPGDTTAAAWRHGPNGATRPLNSSWRSKTGFATSSSAHLESHGFLLKTSPPTASVA